MNTGQDIKLEKPYQLSIGGIIRLLEKHFSYANMDSADWEAIDKEVERIKQIHGCQVIVNDVFLLFLQATKRATDRVTSAETSS